jgi:hypothetical protein
MRRSAKFDGTWRSGCWLRTSHGSRQVSLLFRVSIAGGVLGPPGVAMARGGLEPPTPRFSDAPEDLLKEADLEGFYW